MSHQPSDRSDAAPAATDATLRAELETARANLVRLEAEYAELLVDPGVSLEDRDATRRLMEAARLAAAASERAVARFEDGTYGQCARCGGPIAPERLEVIPDAETCVGCSR